ncbi:acetolactate synthase-1/2/3 large subunit [Agromyces sp. 3263]|uniref:thiamine pyrophosphate-binding protein n=1 Tax=Agromyces sp. 3263 TaxID=2817750 RepID=UPI00285F7442|nr:thiamine pyrophosphate-binding protein [Agromyces sp. 3263]MDR6905615.1 acetolactate synthase-1/2/3 large subunit [Agromyces sp. 3263]
MIDARAAESAGTADPTDAAPTPDAHVRNGGDVVVESLAALGVTHVFGIPGQHALGLFDAIRRSELEFVSSRVENNSAFGADGYARATGEVGVLFLSTGPGALTALGALQEAYATGVPVLVITSQIPRRGLGGARKGLLHQLDDQQQSARNVTKSTALVREAAHIPSALADAWSLAQAAPAGPTWVEIPEDVLLEATDVPPVQSAITSIPERMPRPELVDEAAALLAGAERPVILAGGGVRRSQGGRAALVRLAEALDAPVVSTVGGKGAIPFDHPLSAASWIEDRYTTDLLEQADVLLAVGTAIGEVTSNYFTFAPRGRLIQVDAEPRVLGSNFRGLGIHADAALALSAIADRLPSRPTEHESQRPAGTADRHASGARVAARLRADVEARLAAQDLAAERGLLADLRAAVPADAHTFWDMTIAGYWAWSAWDPERGEFHSAQGSGGLGFAFPAALAAAIGSGRRTLAVSGDGGAMYSIAELATARQHDADVTWLIVDDGGYGILREYMTEQFGQATATELAGPDFAALARAFGVTAHEATLETVGETIARTFREPGPVVVVVPAVLRMFAPTHLQ